MVSEKWGHDLDQQLWLLRSAVRRAFWPFIWDKLAPSKLLG